VIRWDRYLKGELQSGSTDQDHRRIFHFKLDVSLMLCDHEGNVLLFEGHGAQRIPYPPISQPSIVKLAEASTPMIPAL